MWRGMWNVQCNSGKCGRWSGEGRVLSGKLQHKQALRLRREMARKTKTSHRAQPCQCWKRQFKSRNCLKYYACHAKWHSHDVPRLPRNWQVATTWHSPDNEFAKKHATTQSNFFEHTFQHTDGTGVYYLVGRVVWPALHIFEFCYRTIIKIKRLLEYYHLIIIRKTLLNDIIYYGCIIIIF